MATMHRLKELGVRLAINDFGTGCASLSYLKRFPVDFVKIDKSFVDGLGSNATDKAIVEAVVRLAAARGVRVVAEGVETGEQARRLRELGCDLEQCYLYSPPLTAEEAEALLTGGKSFPDPAPQEGTRSANRSAGGRTRGACGNQIGHLPPFSGGVCPAAVGTPSRSGPPTTCWQLQMNRWNNATVLGYIHGRCRRAYYGTVPLL